MNRMTLLGRVKSTPTLKYTQNQTPVLEVDVTDTTKKGETYITQVFTVKLYGRLAEDFANILTAEQEVWAQGEYERRSWVGRDGLRKTHEELAASHFRICLRPGNISKDNDVPDAL